MRGKEAITMAKGFIPKFYRDGAVDGWVYKPAAAATYNIGEALKISSGNVTKASGTDEPLYICMADIVIGTAGDIVPCIPVDRSTEFEVKLSATVSGLAAGVNCSIATSGNSLAANAQGATGHILCVSTTGTASGNVAVVKII